MSGARYRHQSYPGYTASTGTWHNSDFLGKSSTWRTDSVLDSDWLPAYYVPPPQRCEQPTCAPSCRWNSAWTDWPHLRCRWLQSRQNKRNRLLPRRQSKTVAPHVNNPFVHQSYNEPTNQGRNISQNMPRGPYPGRLLCVSTTCVMSLSEESDTQRPLSSWVK